MIDDTEEEENEEEGQTALGGIGDHLGCKNHVAAPSAWPSHDNIALG